MTTPTTLPDTYDFNEHYAPLPVLNQGQSPTCWWHMWAVHLAAFRRMYDGKVVTYQAPAEGGALSYSEPDAITYTWQTPDGPMTIRNIPGASDAYWKSHGMDWPVGQPPPLPPDDVIKAVIYANGVVQCAVAATNALFEKWWFHPDQSIIPTVDLVDGQTPPTDQADHATVIVGFASDERYILQNSWGLPYGCQGRVYVTRRYLEHYGCWVQPMAYDPHPIDGLVMPPPHNIPAPTPTPVPRPVPVGDNVYLFKHSEPTAKAIYSLSGGIVTWIPSMVVMQKQGLSLSDVHPESDDSPLWKLPLIGNRPPAGVL